MSLFYRNIGFMLLITIGFFLFLNYAETLSQNPIFSHPLAAGSANAVADFAIIFFGLLILINWVVEARKKIQKEKISFFTALFAAFIDFGEFHRRRQEAFDKSIPGPLTRSLPNGLYWLLFVVIAGAGLILFLIWRTPDHL
jgi:hypothetical protein